MLARRLGTLVVGALVMAVAPVSTARSVDEPQRILIVGDSVTQGSRGDFTWRYFFSRDHPSADLVGPRTGTFHDWDWNFNGDGAYADPDFDQDHAAFYGGRIGSDENYFYEPIEQNVTNHRPDVIVSLWGINDLWHKEDDPAVVAAIYRNWLARARSVDPGVDFVLGELPYVWVEEVPEFNAKLRALAAEESTDTSRIVVARMAEPYTQAADSLDQVHPNAQGQHKIARMMSEALARLDALNQPVPEPTPDQVAEPSPTPAPIAPQPTATVTITATPMPLALAAPSRPGRVRAFGKRRAVVVRWRPVAVADWYVVTCGTKAEVTQAASLRIRSAAALCRVRAVNRTDASSWVKVRVTPTRGYWDQALIGRHWRPYRQTPGAWPPLDRPPPG